MPQKHHMESNGNSGPSTPQNKCSLSGIEGTNPKQFLLSMPFGRVAFAVWPDPLWFCKIYMLSAPKLSFMLLLLFFITSYLFFFFCQPFTFLAYLIFWNCVFIGLDTPCWRSGWILLVTLHLSNNLRICICQNNFAQGFRFLGLGFFFFILTCFSKVCYWRVCTTGQTSLGGGVAACTFQCGFKQAVFLNTAENPVYPYIDLI